MRTQLRIVAGELRRRRITCDVAPTMRPTPQMVREALFSILGNGVKHRPFIDIFAGTGINGMEALSRGAPSAVFTERDFRLAQSITDHLREFNLSERGRVLRTDAYRWAGMWNAPKEPVSVFLSPPFPDLQKKPETFLELVRNVYTAIAPESVMVIQSERQFPLEDRPCPERWDIRHYGRNSLLIHVKGDLTKPEES